MPKKEQVLNFQYFLLFIEEYLGMTGEYRCVELVIIIVDYIKRIRCSKETFYNQ